MIGSGFLGGWPSAFYVFGKILNSEIEWIMYFDNQVLPHVCGLSVGVFSGSILRIHIHAFLKKNVFFSVNKYHHVQLT
jgi:hypothetical protein